ncbi:PQQ-binding-like beta-propeller repeat protein, partial [bacterium]|nr:PQQ-binding-like beta-propeller repeat protein [bacterium]
ALHGGLIIHLGCGDGTLPAALRRSERYVVHGLDTEAANVARARAYVHARQTYGPVSIERFDGKRLPHADNLANLLVAESLGGLPLHEAMRVLAPGGTLYTKQDGQWRKTVKPRPTNVDEWTHYLHDASGNPVAHDTVVGPPRHAQWIAGPRHTRSHEHTPGIYALVSTGGRIFYIADQAPIASVLRTPRWQLVARDAYNGLRLWQRPTPTWFPHIVNWCQSPNELQRRLVAVNDRVYVTLGFHAPISVLDAATGKTLQTYADTDGAEEMVCHDGTLLAVIRRVTKKRTDEFAKMTQLTSQRRSPLHDRDSADPLVRQFRRSEGSTERTLVALDAATGQPRWKKTGPDIAGLRVSSLCACGDRVLYYKAGAVVCLDLKTGRPLWQKRTTPLRVASPTHAVCVGGDAVTALSTETGKALWTQPATLCQVRDVFLIGTSVWLGGFKPYQGRKTGKRGPAWGPYFATERALATGKILRRVEPENPGHHHRCWSNKATDRYILGGRRGVEFIDLKTGDVRWHSWVRGVCRYGVMPANGLLYAPPHSCGCYMAAKLAGFNALAPAIATADADTPQPEPLTRGPAYAAIANRKSAVGNSSDWPTYRHDAQRSGSTAANVPAVLERRWQLDMGGRLTSPTVADGKVFVASVDDHSVRAMDAATGKTQWHFTAGARVDSPPTLHQGRALFGCRDGHAYSVRLSDGALAWRLRLARRERRIMASGQLESASPLHGSVLVRQGVAYCTAGRSSYLDGGIALCRVATATGKILSTTQLYSPDPKTGRQPAHFGPCNMPGERTDILSCDDQHVYLRDSVFDHRGARQAKGSRHLFALTGFLDDTWPHRSYWVFGTRCSISTGCSGRDRNLISGRLCVLDKSAIYGYGRTKLHWSNHLQDGPYHLFALHRNDGKKRWTTRLLIHVRAMLLAGTTLFVAGPPVDSGYWPEATRGAPTAQLLAISAADGSVLAKCGLDAAPVFDGMAASAGRLYVSLENGQLACLAAPVEGQ